MMDTDLYLEEYNPYGTSIFSYAKVQELSVKYHPHGNDLIFGYPSPDCGCFPGCNDFLTPSGVHHTNFCCSDWQSICVNREFNNPVIKISTLWLFVLLKI